MMSKSLKTVGITKFNKDIDTKLTYNTVNVQVLVQ